MVVNSLVIDDFYTNPYDVRDFALSQEFVVEGNYPGRRTDSYLNDDIKELIGSTIEPFAGRITNWGGEYSGSFQYTTSRDRSWIHTDHHTSWAGVCYLTPDAPLSSGTGLFRHKETGYTTLNFHDEELPQEITEKLNNDSQDMTKWEMVDRIGNVFNRLILYRADNFHISLDYFGQDKYDGRLFQVFFFNTEK
jgi:hypothetical protein